MKIEFQGECEFTKLPTFYIIVDNEGSKNINIKSLKLKKGNFFLKKSIKQRH